MPAATGDQQVPRPQEVFISYSRKDKDFVRRLDEALKSRGREAWVDWEDIRPTEEFMQAIYGAIEGADTFVFVLTPDYVASIPCGREIAHAAANNKRMVPIVAREVKADTVPEALAKLNWIFFRDTDDFEKATDTLISAIDTDLDWVHLHTRLLTRAIQWEANRKNNSFVLRGEELRSAGQWLAQAGANKEPKPTALQTEYINASRKAARRRRQITLGAVTLAFLIASVLSVMVFFSQAKATKQTRVAVAAKKETDETTSQGNVLLSSRLADGGKNAQALAQLAKALRLNPDNREASGFTVALLTQLSWCVPLTGLMPHNGGINSAQFSPEGQRVVTASTDKTARVWDASSGKPVGEPMKHELPVNSAQFSMDGQRVVTASNDKTARVWDASSGKSLGEPMKHEERVNSARFSPDGQWVVTASADGTARVWDATSGKPVGKPMQHGGVPFGGVLSAQFSPDGRQIVTASADMTARVWDAASGRAVGEPMKHENGVVSAQFSPDGQRIVTASVDGTARLWDVAGSRPIGQPPMTHEDWVSSAEFSPDGKYVVTASRDNTARVWNAASGKPVGEPMKHGPSVDPAQLSGDMASVWNIARSKFAAHFSPNSQRVVTASWDGTAQVWDATSGKPISEPMKDENGLLSARFSPDGQRIVTASWGKTARVWDAATGKRVGDPMKHEQLVWSAQFSPNSQWVVTASYDMTARVWDAASGKPIGEAMKHEGYVNSAQFSMNSQRVVTASWDMTARVWDAANGKQIGQPMKHESGVLSAEFSSDGQRVVTASADLTARLWDAASGRPIGQPMKHEGAVWSAHFSPDGQRVVTASTDKTARVWDAASGRPVSEPLIHEDEVLSAQFSPDGNRVVTASKDGTARVWDAVSVTDKDTKEDILLLAELAEAAAGATGEPAGQAENVHLLTPDQVVASRKKIAERYARMSSGLTPLERFLKWSVSDARSRTISPFSQVTIAEWLENRIKEGTVEGLRAAIQVDPANARVTAYLGRRLADQALKQGSDPDEARRARGEADFLTNRALQLAPDNDEVKRLRDEVIKLLGSELGSRNRRN